MPDISRGLDFQEKYFSIFFSFDDRFRRKVLIRRKKRTKVNLLFGDIHMESKGNDSQRDEEICLFMCYNKDNYPLK